MFRRSPVGCPEAEEIQDIHVILTCPGTWRVELEGIKMPEKEGEQGHKQQPILQPFSLLLSVKISVNSVSLQLS